MRFLDIKLGIPAFPFFRRGIKTQNIASLLIAAAIAFAGCNKDDGDGDGDDIPSLVVSPAIITASTAAESYPITVTSETPWTATVGSGATWCTLTDNSAADNGTITVTVAENTETNPRTATITVTAGKANLTVSITQEAVIPPDPPAPPASPPTYAISDRTWKFGSSSLVWSDVVQIPDCNGTSFSNSLTVPKCRSYTSGGKTYYYYNWPYVHANAASLCPSPWRVPDFWDVKALSMSVNSVSLSSAWGFGGRASDANIDEADIRAWIWTSNEAPDHPETGWFLGYRNNQLAYSYEKLYYGFQVRCVR